MTLTAEQILALAPDPASAKAGNAQSSPAHWSGLGGHAQALWGLCQGSGKEPYKAQIDLAGPAFKCSCPSRKFPCKHGLGLYLLYEKQRAAFSDGAEPAWVSDWLQSREQKVEKKAARLAEAELTQTPEGLAAKALGQQKRLDKRESNVSAGCDLLETWLADLAREGLAGLRARPAKDWESMAARMVDAQAGGLAARVRRAGMLVYGSSQPGWEVPLARELAQLALLVQGYRRIATLPPALQHDVRSALGWVAGTDEALAEAGVTDLWQVCGNHTQGDERISRRACYLRGRQSGRWAMLLQFSAGSQALPPPLIPGTRHQGTLHFYPGANPLRVAFGADMALCESAAGDAAATGAAPAAMLDEYAHALARNPFLEPQPVLLDQVAPHYVAEPAPHWLLRAADGGAVPVDIRFGHGWQMHALAGGVPATVFGLWNGCTLLPLAITVNDRLHGFDSERA
ncbi:MAG: SWIM zinc finger family protein [Pseudomonadota bacterium]